MPDGRDGGELGQRFGRATDAFKPGQEPGASSGGGGERRAAMPAPHRLGGDGAYEDGGGRPVQRRAAAAGPAQARQRHGRAVLPGLIGSQLTAMSAESDALNEQIKQSVALLRRHL